MGRRSAVSVLAGVLAVGLAAAPAQAQIRPPVRRPKPPSTSKKKKEPKVHLALEGGDVWNPTGAWLRDATVLVAGDRIKAVGTNLRIPKDAKRINCHGKRLTPGFIALRGSTYMVLTGSGKVEDRLNPYDPDMEMALAGGVTALHISTGCTTSVIRLARGGHEHMLGRTDVTAPLTSASISGSWRSTRRPRRRARR